MRFVAHLAPVVLGLGLLASGGTFLLGMIPEQTPPPEGSPVALFMGAMYPSGYLHFVKWLELLAGALLLPATRAAALLVWGPILVNILAFHVFRTDRSGLLDIPHLAFVALTVIVLMQERRAFKGFIPCRAACASKPLVPSES